MNDDINFPAQTKIKKDVAALFDVGASTINRVMKKEGAFVNG